MLKTSYLTIFDQTCVLNLEIIICNLENDEKFLQRFPLKYAHYDDPSNNSHLLKWLKTSSAEQII